MTASRRYVVLHHTGHGHAHFDLMLDADDDAPLLTWRCPTWPMNDAESATPLPPHRRTYLSYEGAVSEGRGWVRRVAAGRCVIVQQTDLHMIVRIENDFLKFLKK